MYINNYNRSK